MKQHYFVVVLAHSLHGRLRRVQIPHKALYVVLALALLGGFSLFGMVSSYLRMTWKVANYNSLREEIDVMRVRYQELREENNQKQEQLASLQMMASEVSVAFGLKNTDRMGSIADEGPQVPVFNESFEQYNFLKSASMSRLHRTYARKWQKNIVPSLWPVNGRISSGFGTRVDPFAGIGEFHPGVDIEADMGTPVHAAADGIVYSAENFAGYGKLVVVDHGNGMRTLYGHLSRYNVVPGQEIRKGEVLAYSGNTGRVTGAHLHFEVRIGGTSVNPYPYLAKAVVTAQGSLRDLPF